MAGSGLSVFAVEPNAVQLTWRKGRDGAPGVALFEGLTPDAAHHLHVDELDEAIEVHTPAAPAGRELSRVATINDLHIGSERFGFLGTMHEPKADVPHALRCLRSAVADALRWGAQLLIVKGDLTHHGTPEEWAAIGDELAGLPVPVAVVPGNHDVRRERTVDPRPGLALHGLHLVHGAEVVDLPGVRIVLVDTAVTGRDAGRIAHLHDEVVRRVGRAGGPAIVAMHHQVNPYPVPTYLPVGIPYREGQRFLRALAAANPRTLVVSGHTHRHRRHRRGSITVAEVGSTKDYPGGWAGYVVHEGGMRQVVRRISDPTCLPWLEHTRRAALGLWGHWSPGRLDDRCFSVLW